MKNRYNYFHIPLYILVCISFVFFLHNPAQAGTKKLGEPCTTNPQCKSGDCEEGADEKYYCDCSNDAYCKTLMESRMTELGKEGANNPDNYSCQDGATITNDLDYCMFVPQGGNKDEAEFKTPANVDPGANLTDILGFAIDSVLDQRVAGKIAQKQLNEARQIISKPVTQIIIPGLSFSEINTVEEDGDTYFQIPFLGDYISALYQWAVIAATILSVIVIVIAGFLWTTSAGNQGTITKAKSMLANAMFGLFIALGSYTFLYTINPDLVKLKHLRVKFIQKELLSIEGLLTDDYGGDTASNLAKESTEIINGGFRERMMDACGEKKGFSDTNNDYSKRQELLLGIVKNWKKEGLDNAGAVYIRGGSPACTYFHIDHNWTFNVMASLYKKEPTLFTSMENTCKNPVAAASSLGYRSRMNLPNKGPTTCSKPTGPWNTLYKTLAVDRARDAGLLCGDCASFLRTLFFKCFNNGNYTELVTSRFNNYRPRNLKNGSCQPEGVQKSDSRYVFLLNENQGISQDQIDKLEFGDVIAWKGRSGGHVMLYTGGKDLGYEILEMGGGGRADVTGRGKAGRYAKIPWKISGMRAHKSALTYLTTTKKKSSKCMYAFRPLK